MKTTLIRYDSPQTSHRGGTTTAHSGSAAHRSTSTKQPHTPVINEMDEKMHSAAMERSLNRSRQRRRKDLESAMASDGEEDEDEVMAAPTPPVPVPNERNDTIIVRIEVSDSGPGIRPSELQQSGLFSP